MASELALHIGVNGHHRDGDILRVTFTYDAQRVVAETVSNGRHSSVRDFAHIATLRRAYLDITDPNKQPQPTEAGLADWWTECETLTGLSRGDFSNFPYSNGDRGIVLIVSLDREATMGERSEWTGKTEQASRDETIPVPMRVDWKADIMPGLRVRRGRDGDVAATVADVQKPRRIIHVLDAISPSVIRSRA